MRDSFQQAGEPCESCIDRWKSQGLPPQILVPLPAVTEVYHSEVAVCEYCDGRPIVMFSFLNHPDD